MSGDQSEDQSDTEITEPKKRKRRGGKIKFEDSKMVNDASLCEQTSTVSMPIIPLDPSHSIHRYHCQSLRAITPMITFC